MRAAALLTLAVGASALAATASAPGASTACTPSVRTIKGFQMRVFCGPAKATVKVQVGQKAAKTYVFKNGQCDRYPKYFVVNIGTVVLGTGSNRPKLPYFGLLMGKSPAATSRDPVVAKDGTYKGGLITINTAGGASYGLSGPEQLTITLKNKRRAGTFVGKRPGSMLFDTPAIEITGSFTC
jgi:hypothetical protein